MRCHNISFRGGLNKTKNSMEGYMFDLHKHIFCDPSAELPLQDGSCEVSHCIF